MRGAPVRRPGCAAGPPLCWEASGGEIPRCTLAADSLPPGRFEPSPSRWRAATPPPPPVVWPWPHVAAPRLCPSPSVRPPQSAPRLLLPWAAPWCVSLPGLAAAAIRCRFRRRLSTDVVACLTRGSARDPRRPTRPPPRPRSGALVRTRVGSPVCPQRAGRRVLAARHPPPLWGGGTDVRRGRVGRPRCGLAGGPRPGSRGRRGGRARDGGGVGRRRGPAALLPSFLHAVAAARCDLRGLRVCAQSGILAAGGAGRSVGLSVGFLAQVSAFRTPSPRVFPLARCSASRPGPPPARGTPGFLSSCYFLSRVIYLFGEGSGDPLQYPCLENFHGRRSLIGCSPWGR